MENVRERITQTQEVLNYMERRVNEYLRALETKYSWINKFELEYYGKEAFVVSLTDSCYAEPDHHWDKEIPVWVVEYGDDEFNAQIEAVKKEVLEKKQKAEVDRIKAEKKERQKEIESLSARLKNLLKNDL